LRAHDELDTPLIPKVSDAGAKKLEDCSVGRHNAMIADASNTFVDASAC
jgi:hypothetical protein